MVTGDVLAKNPFSGKARRRIPHLLTWFFIVFPLLLVAGCSRPDTDSERPVTINAWFHTGRPQETRVITDQVARFNASQKNIHVKLTLIPEGEYNTQVQAAAADGKLPDILDLDGPYLANYAWKENLVPLGPLLNEKIKDQLIPSIIEQGTYDEKLYAVGTFDSGLGLYGNRTMLHKIGARIPASPETAWSVDEFDTILAHLAQHDSDKMVLDLRMDYRGEWLTYAFSPILQSGGGDLIDRNTFGSAAGVLNSPESIKALQHLQTWFQEGYVDPNTDANSFTGGRVALSWCGHWEYPRYYKALGEELILLPLPDFGTGPRTGMGSWCWAITTLCQHPEKAVRFVEFLLKKNEVLAMCEANGAVPATKEAIAASRLYQEGGPLNLFVKQLRQAVPRPQTPAYPVITSAFQEAFQNIRHGEDIKTALNRAVQIIDEDIDDNWGYRHFDRL